MRHVETNKSVMILTYKIVYISETIEFSYLHLLRFFYSVWCIMLDPFFEPLYRFQCYKYFYDYDIFNTVFSTVVHVRSINS